jgi:uncharacterized membrane protein YeaQ/YmgE (transglycosylase-associated protein family)
MIGSVLAYIGTGFVWSTLDGFLGAALDNSSDFLPFHIAGIPFSLEYSVLGAMVLLALIQFILYYFVAWLILDKALNLD